MSFSRKNFGVLLPLVMVSLLEAAVAAPVRPDPLDIDDDEFTVVLTDDDMGLRGFDGPASGAEAVPETETAVLVFALFVGGFLVLFIFELAACNEDVLVGFKLR